MFVPRLPPFGSKERFGELQLRLPPFRFYPGTHDSSEASRFLNENSGLLRQNFFSLVILLLPKGGLLVSFSLRPAHHTLVGRAGAYTEPRPGQSKPAPRPSEAQGSPSRAEGWSPPLSRSFTWTSCPPKCHRGINALWRTDAVPFYGTVVLYSPGKAQKLRLPLGILGD